MAGSQGPNHVHYSTMLTNVSVAYTPTGLIAEELFPRKRVENEVDLFWKFDKSAFNIVDDERADGTPENESTGGWTEVPYQVRAYGLSDKITKRMRRNADSGLQLEVTTTERLTQQLKNKLEYQVLGSGGIVRTDGNNTGSVNADWSGSSASPKADIMAAITAIQKASGQTPNVMVCNPDILRQLTLTAEYREEVKFTNDMRTLPLPDSLWGLKVLQAGGLANLTAGFAPQKKGLAVGLNYIMDNDVWIGYVKEGGIGMRDLTYGVTFFTEQYSRKWWDDKAEVDWVAVDDIRVSQVIATECGYLISSPFG